MTSNVLHEIQRFEYKEPGILAKDTLDEFKFKRYASPKRFQKLDNKCMWCNDLPVDENDKKYCSYNCRISAKINCFNNSYESKGFMLINQQFKCAICGNDYHDFIRKRIGRSRADLSKKESVTIRRLGRWISSLMDADHKVAICNGGHGTGIDNIHLICESCHKEKTRLDLQKMREAAQSLWNNRIKNEEKEESLFFMPFF